MDTIAKPQWLKGLPLDAADFRGAPLGVGDTVTLLTVESAATALDEPEQARLRRLVGEQRRIVEFDRWGFAWLSIDPRGLGPYFCLFPNDLARASVRCSL